MGGFAAIFKGLIGGDPLKSIGDLIEQFHLSPDQKAQVQQAAAELQVKREEIEAARDQALEQIAASDRDSARKMQTAVRSIMPPLLGCFVIVSCGFTEYWVMIHGFAPGLDPIVVGRILGTLDAAALLVLSYYFGSSAGSERKTDIIAGQK